MTPNPAVGGDGTEPVVGLLAAEWASLATLGDELSPSEWATPTELPGWTVQDCYSHVVGIERELLGDPPAPPVDLADHPHLTALSSAVTEPAVALRRTRSGPEVLAELRQAADARLEALGALDEAAWSASGPTPVGDVPYREFMEVRLFDCWMHEQDVRRALDRPGHQEGPVAEHGLGRCIKALGFIVGKKAGAPDGTSVTFVVDGPLARTVHVAVRQGRAQVVEALDTDATVTLAMDAQTLWCLVGGRWDAASVLSAGSVTITGDGDLGRAILDAANIMI